MYLPVLLWKLQRQLTPVPRDGTIPRREKSKTKMQTRYSGANL
jgi:hypothetical protein